MAEAPAGRSQPCTASGCHTGGADVARSLFLNEKQTVQVLIDNLWKDDGTLTAAEAHVIGREGITLERLPLAPLPERV